MVNGNNSKKFQKIMNYLLVYKYSKIHGGIPVIIRHLGQGLLNNNHDNQIFILAEHENYRQIQYSYEDNFHVYYLNIKNVLILLLRKKIDITCFFEPYTKYILLAGLFKIVKRKTATNLIFCGSKTESPSIFIKRLASLIIRLFNGLIAISEYSKQVALKGKYLSKIKVIYIPVVTDNYKVSNFKKNNLITIGRICPRKNYRNLIKMFSIVHKLKPKIHLDIIGGYENIHINYNNEILKLISDEQLQNYVTFHGDVTEKKKIRLLAESRIYVTTSKHEMFGITTAEAMASGLPIIAYDNTATREVVLSANGILIENGRYDLMAKEVTNLITNEDKIHQLSIKSQNAAKLYDLEYFIKGYLNLFQEQYNSNRIKKISLPLISTLKTILKKAKNILILKKYFKVVNTLGKGKDGKIFLCKNEKNEQKVVKVLSDFGKQYLPITKEYIKRQIISQHLYHLEIIHDSFIIYSYEALFPIKTDVKNFLNFLLQICDLEMDLIKYGLYFWDLGFIDHGNYMVNKDGQIKIIDYGGNSFLLLDCTNKIEINNQRKNLIYAKKRFVSLQMILHIFYFGLGRRTRELYSTSAQNWNEAQLERCIEFCNNELQDTVYGEIVKSFIKNNLLTINGWQNVKKIINNKILSGVYNQPQESADIHKIQYFKNKIEVRGYQNFDITPSQIFPLSHNGKPLWDTKTKFNLVDKSLKIITTEEKINSFLDIGSNLGLYVFLANISYRIPECIGLDYNQKYIEVCNNISNNFNLKNCKFIKKNFKEINNKYDCVLAMGIIHHLFHRTEEFGSLKTIIKLFADMTNKYLIIEFPTENDPKAKKWTNIPGRNKGEEYNYKNFFKYSKQYFSKIKKVDEIHQNRILFILKK